MIWSTTPVASALSRPVATGRILRSSGMRLSAVPTPRLRRPGVVIPCGTTTCKQLSRLDTDPADLLHPASDVCLLPPAGFATGLVASRCPWEDLHLLDNFNRFHRGCHPRIPTVTSLTRHDMPWLGAGCERLPTTPWLPSTLAPLPCALHPWSLVGDPSHAWGVTMHDRAACHSRHARRSRTRRILPSCSTATAR